MLSARPRYQPSDQIEWHNIVAGLIGGSICTLKMVWLFEFYADQIEGLLKGLPSVHNKCVRIFGFDESLVDLANMQVKAVIIY